MISVFETPERMLKCANSMLWVGLMVLLTGIVFAYWLDRYLPLPVLVGAHAMTILGPTLIKLGYVMRLMALNRQRLSRIAEPIAVTP